MTTTPTGRTRGMEREVEMNSVETRQRGMQRYTDECSLTAHLPHRHTRLHTHVNHISTASIVHFRKINIRRKFPERLATSIAHCGLVGHALMPVNSL